MSDLNLSEKFIITPTGLQVNEANGAPSFDEWMAYGQTLWAMRSAIQWAIADWIQYGEHTYGEKYAQALDQTHVSYQTLRNYVWTATRFPVSRRRDNLSFSHHQELAAIKDDTIQDALLTRAKKEHLGRDEVRELAKPFKPKRQPKVSAPVIVEPVESIPTISYITYDAKISHVGLGVVTLNIDNPDVLDTLRRAMIAREPVSLSVAKCPPPETIDAALLFGGGVNRAVDTRLVVKEAS